MTRYRCEYERWLQNADEESVRLLKEIENDDREIEYRFSKNLSFGTAGLRGVMMPGLYAMNAYTVGAATAGLARYIRELGAEERGVLIGCDSRLHSREFAERAACVMVENGVKVYLFDELRPTPMVSYGVRELNCIAGINITASHNPKEYNGYKVYYEDGAQISPAQAQIIASYIDRTDVFSVSAYPYEKALKEGKIVLLGRDFDEKYLARVMEEQVDREAVKRAKDLKIVYTPFHGAGYRLVPEVLRRIGVGQLYVVPEQEAPDGNFPTVRSPNPENPEGFACGIALAKRIGADLVIATDPDCDRVGVTAKNAAGEFETVSGNCMGALLLDYIMRAHKENGTTPPDPYAVKTIVTTDLALEVCRRYGVKLYEVLTGFKYIGEVMTGCQRKGKGSFILGYEESYGYLKGTYARDKDGVVASMLIAEMAAYYASRSMTLIDAREELMKTFGFFAEKTVSVQFPGVDAAEKMRKVMEKIRRDPPETIGGVRVRRVGDYLDGYFTCKVTGNRKKTGLPRSDVLSFTLFDRCKVLVRPSGTEPKVKIYFLCRGKDAAQAQRKIAACEEDMRKYIR